MSLAEQHGSAVETVVAPRARNSVTRKDDRGVPDEIIEETRRWQRRATAHRTTSHAGRASSRNPGMGSSRDRQATRPSANRRRYRVHAFARWLTQVLGALRRGGNEHPP